MSAARKSPKRHAPTGKASRRQPQAVRACRACGCTDDDCGACIARTSHPCSWVEDDLCSACAVPRALSAARAAQPGDPASWL